MNQMLKLKTRNAHYRYAHIVLKDGTAYHETLESLYRRAMESEEIQQPVTKDVGGGAYLALGTDAEGDSVYNSQSCACGWLSIYTQDRKVPTVTVDNNGVRSSECDPTDAEGNPNNWEEDSLIFSIKGNHVALFLSVRGRAERLEDMLNWLLLFKLQLLPEGSRVYFDNPLNQNIEDKIRMCNIREIEVKTSSSPAALSSANMLPCDWFQATGTGLMQSVVDVIKQRISTTGQNRFTSGLGTSENIVPPLSLHMRFRAHHSSIDEAQATLRLLAAGTDGVENLKVRFYMEDDSKIEGDQLTIKERLQVDFFNGNIVKERAMSTLAGWLTKMIEERIIRL